MRNKKLLPVGLLLLGIGFATVTTTLIMTGNVKIATNDRDFDVIFTKAVLDGIDESDYCISTDGKSIRFPTSDLITVGDVSKVDFEVTNNSEIYDAEVSIDCSATGEKSSYYSIYKEVATPIEAKTTKAGKVEVTLTKAPVDDIHEDFTCTLTATAKERTEKAPIYYAFGEPLTTVDRATDYTTLTYPYDPYGQSEYEGTPAKVFVKLEGNQRSVCIIRNNKLECFRGGTNDYYEEEKAHLQAVFSDITCSSYSHSDSNVYCSASDFYCSVDSDGEVGCNDEVAGFYCSLNYGLGDCGRPS